MEISSRSSRRDPFHTSQLANLSFFRGLEMAFSVHFFVGNITRKKFCGKKKKIKEKK